MTHDGPSQDQVTIQLEDALYALRRTANEGADVVKTVVGLPKAFLAVAERLPVVIKAIESLQKSVEDEEPTQDVVTRFGAIGQLASSCRTQAVHLQGLYRAVKPTKSPVPKLERYRKAVSSGDGGTVETTLKFVLDQALDQTVASLYEDELTSELNEAVKEVAALEPSLKEDSDAKRILNNYGDGPQMFHDGKGDINNCSGGIQVTGKQARNYLGKEVQQ